MNSQEAKQSEQATALRSGLFNDKQTFQKPPGKDGGPKQLDEKVVQAYWSKLRPYKCWEGHYMAMGDDVCIFTAPGQEPLKMNRAEAVEWFKINKIEPTRFLFAKPSKLNVAYMWEADETRIQDKDLDAIDRVFLKEFDQAEGIVCHKLFGYHTYGGYYGNFRPDLNEVIHLIAAVVPDPDKVDRIYVSTQPYPSDIGSACYDSSVDMHRALTMAHCVVLPTV